MNSGLIGKLAAITVVICMSTSLQAQHNSDNTYYNRLYYLCKAWGHIKYYHSEVAAGNVDWDDELLASLPIVKNAISNEEYNEVVRAMLNNAGIPEQGSGDLPEIVDSLNNNTDLSWIYDIIFTDTVSALLDTIQERFRPMSNVYVNRAGTSNPTFNSDNQYYSGLNYPSEEKRILAVFRYWNIINYFFPYKDIMDQHWDSTLVEFLPKIVEAENSLSYHLAFKEFTTHINDSHAFFSSQAYTSWRGNYYPPFHIRFIEGETVLTNVIDSMTTFKVGDVIKKIDGMDINIIRDSLRRYAHGSNSVIVNRSINDIILYGDLWPSQMTIENDSGSHSGSFFRNSTNYNLLNSTADFVWRIDTTANDCHIGIVDMGILESEQVASMFDDLWNTEAIIFDIRNYPNGTLWDIVDYLYPTSVKMANFTVPDNKYPGRLYWVRPSIGSGGSNTYSGTVIILFDERTQSQAEYTCMGLDQFPNVIKIGSTTSGADGNVSPIYLPGKILTSASFLGVFYPDYTPTQRIGIVPDIEIHPTIQGIRSRVDEVMDYALNLLECLTSVDDEKATPEVSVYPNPVAHKLQYELSSAKSFAGAFIQIIDVNGQVLKTEYTLATKGEIDISSLPSSIYFLKLNLGGHIFTTTIVKI